MIHQCSALISIVQRTGFFAFVAASRHAWIASRLPSASGSAATIISQLAGDARCIRCVPASHGVGSSKTRAATLSGHRSEEHTSELQSLMRISYAVFCLKKKKKHMQLLGKIPTHKTN